MQELLTKFPRTENQRLFHSTVCVTNDKQTMVTSTMNAKERREAILMYIAAMASHHPKDELYVGYYTNDATTVIQSLANYLEQLCLKDTVSIQGTSIHFQTMDGEKKSVCLKIEKSNQTRLGLDDTVSPSIKRSRTSQS